VTLNGVKMMEILAIHMQAVARNTENVLLKPLKVKMTHSDIICKTSYILPVFYQQLPGQDKIKQQRPVVWLIWVYFERKMQSLLLDLL